MPCKRAVSGYYSACRLYAVKKVNAHNAHKQIFRFADAEQMPWLFLPVIFHSLIIHGGGHIFFRGRPPIRNRQNFLHRFPFRDCLRRFSLTLLPFLPAQFPGSATSFIFIQFYMLFKHLFAHLCVRSKSLFLIADIFHGRGAFVKSKNNIGALGVAESGLIFPEWCNE